MKYHDKIKQTCSGTKVFAVCTVYETPTPLFSGLYGETCTDVEEALTDVYSLLGDIKEEIDVTTLVNDCITFTEPKTAKSVLSQIYNKMCELEDTITSQETLITNLTARVASLEANPCV